MKVSKRNRSKLFKQKFSMMYSHYDDYERDIDDEGHIVLGLGLSVWAIYWGIIHVIDKFTFNFMPWWVEPFTAFPLVGLLALVEIFGKNPLHWWPLFWGTKIKTCNDDDDPIKHTLHLDGVIERMGGPANVYIVDWQTIKFRKKKDIVKYLLFKS